MSKKYITMAVLKAKDGKREKLLKELLKLIDPTRDEEGCLEYILFEDKNATGTFYMRETFQSKSAFEFHTNTEHFKNFASQINTLMDEAITLIELEKVSH